MAADELPTSARLREVAAERDEVLRELIAERHDHAHTRAAAERYRVRRDLVAAELASARVEIDRLRAEKGVDGEVIGDQATALQAAAEEIVKLRGFWGACSAHRDVLLAENRVLRDRLARAYAQCALPATQPDTQPDTQRHSAPQTEEPSS